MVDKVYIAVIDIDDTLNNLAETTYNRLGLRDKFYQKRKYYLKDCPELTESERKAMEEAWHQAETFLACDAHYGIEEVDTLSLRDNVAVIIHSYCCSEDAAEGKLIWLDSRADCSRLDLRLEVGKKTPIENVDFVIEDNLEYLCTCDAPYRILVDKPHNQEEHYDLDTTGIIRVFSLYEALQYVLEKTA